MGLNPASMLRGDVTYWAPAQEDRFGNLQHSDPELIQGRWEERSEEVTTQTGETIVSRAIVFVDRDLSINGWLAEGDHTAAAPSPDSVGAQQIEVFQRIPSLRTNTYERRAVL